MTIPWRWTPVAVAVGIAALCSGCGAGPSAHSTSGTTTSAPPSVQIPISVSAALSSDGQNPTLLMPSSCTLQANVLTAVGSFAYPFVPESYLRYGDVVELYAFTVPMSATQTLQVAALEDEHPFPMSGAGPWRVTVPIDRQVGLPAQCVVAVQVTHAFMGAGSAGG